MTVAIIVEIVVFLCVPPPSPSYCPDGPPARPWPQKPAVASTDSLTHPRPALIPAEGPTPGVT